MGMQFEVTVTGDITYKNIDASIERHIDAESVIDGLAGELEVVDAEVTESVVTIKASVRRTGYMVDAEDIEDFDGYLVLDEECGHWDTSISNVEVEVTEGPTGFDEVEDAIGRDHAIAAYQVLAASGFTVS